MRTAFALLLVAVLSGCGGGSHRAERRWGEAPPLYGTARWHGTVRHDVGRHHATHRRTTRRHATHPAHRIPPGTFDQETRRRCDAGDGGACRMLRAMGGGGS